MLPVLFATTGLAYWVRYSLRLTGHVVATQNQHPLSLITLETIGIARSSITARCACNASSSITVGVIGAACVCHC
jgi:heme/copper-type cytochrome/quinol oxidase subunit 3